MSIALRRLVLAVTAVLVLGRGSAGAALVAGDHDRTLTTGGHVRTYYLHVPPGYADGTPVPLVLDFHGLSSDANQQRGLSGMLGESDRHGFLVVHPNGVNHAWNAGICCGNKDIDDVAFVRALVDAVAAEASVDRRRVYATGLSNGGAMSQYLACEAADLIAAAAPLAFPLPYASLSACRPVRAMPVLFVMGLTDVLVTYDRGPFATAPDTFAYWHDVNGCSGTTPDATVTSGQSRCETYTHCASGVETGLCSVVARAFPGYDFSGHILYLQNDFNLASVAWDFLSRFTLPDTAAPVRTDLYGTSELRVGRGKAARTRQALTWTLTLGAGVWSATDDAGHTFTGSARARGHGKRRLALGLTADSRATLDTVLTARLAASTNSVGVEVGVAPTDQLVLSLDRSGQPTRITGRLHVLRGGTPGATIGRFTVKARR